MSDDPYSLEGHYLSFNIAGSDASPEELAAACEDVSVDEVAEIARNAECDAIYYLRAGEDGEDEEA